MVEIAGAGEPAEPVNEMDKMFRFFKMTSPFDFVLSVVKGQPVSNGRVSRCSAPTLVIAGGAFFLSPMRGVEPLRRRLRGWSSQGSGTRERTAGAPRTQPWGI